MEYAIGRPVVIRHEREWSMWYSYRAHSGGDYYRIGFATSIDGVEWERRDREVGIDVSDEGWDSEMICYPWVFRHLDRYFMLYNGNGYGKSGIGAAILVDDAG